MPILDSWNICDKDGEYKDIHNRTNNGLESYNRRINKIFSSGVPSLIEFVVKIEKESRYQSSRLDEIRNFNEDAPALLPVTIPVISSEYLQFLSENS